MWLTIPAFLTLAATPPPLSLPPPLFVQETAEATDVAADLKKRLIALEDEFADARQEWYGKANAAWGEHQAAGGTGADFEPPPPFEPDFYPRFAELADAGSSGATMWCLGNHMHSGLEGEAAKTDKNTRINGVLDGEPSNKDLNSLCRVVMGEADGPPSEGADPSRLGSKAVFALFDRIHEMATDDNVKANTMYMRAEAIKAGNDRPGYGVRVDADAKAEEWYKRAAKEYPDTEIGQRCGGLAFASENLQIGMVAPDIVGKDHDGNDIKRSDFAGKVTVLDFWGFW